MLMFEGGCDAISSLGYLVPAARPEKCAQRRSWLASAAVMAHEHKPARGGKG